MKNKSIMSFFEKAELDVSLLARIYSRDLDGAMHLIQSNELSNPGSMGALWVIHELSKTGETSLDNTIWRELITRISFSDLGSYNENGPALRNPNYGTIQSTGLSPRRAGKCDGTLREYKAWVLHPSEA